MTTEIMQSAADQVDQAPEVPFSLLLVDDEPNILSALRRLFRPLGYRVLTAESGQAGLDILGEEQVDLVISDMRMPGMDGAQFLEQVHLRYPDTMRMLLTGYADIHAIAEAINKGQIYRYVAKPWEENDIVTAVRHAIDRKRLECEKARLEALTRRQNEELKELNATLEDKVRIRTEELAQAYEKLKKSFFTSIRVFSSLIEMRESSLSGHSRRVAELARTVAQKMGMSEADIQDVFVAGLLHDIGKIGIPDKLLSRPWPLLSQDEKTQFARHSINGEASLMALDQLHGAAKLIRSHHERFDGIGYPDGLRGETIPLGARILAAVNDYDAAQIGTLTETRLGPSEALSMLVANKERRYDPAVVDAVVDVLIGPKLKLKRKAEVQTISRELRPGMVLARDMYNEDTMLLLPKNTVLNAKYIEKIREFEHANARPLTIFVLVREVQILDD